MDKTRCLIIGGSGFLGSHLSRALKHQGAEVNILSRDLSRSEHLYHFNLFLGSLQNLESLEAAIADCSVVFHLGSSTIPSTSNLDPQSDIEVNLKGSINLIHAALKAKVRKIIFASSGGTVYGIQPSLPISEKAITNPICSYGIVKLSIEKYLHMYYSIYGLDYCVLRIANPFGEGQGHGRGQGLVANVIARSLRGESFEIWGDGSVIRDYIYVDDVISALLRASEYSGNYKVFNIGTGVGRSIIEVLDSIEKALNFTIARTFKPSRSVDVPKNVLDVALAREELNWEPVVPWEVGLHRTYSWIKDNL